MELVEGYRKFIVKIDAKVKCVVPFNLEIRTTPFQPTQSKFRY